MDNQLSISLLANFVDEIACKESTEKGRIKSILTKIVTFAAIGIVNKYVGDTAAENVKSTFHNDETYDIFYSIKNH